MLPATLKNTSKMETVNRPASPYAAQPASQGYISCLDKDIETVEEARHTKGLGQKAVETLNRCLGWLIQYRRGIEHSLTHWAATERANAETGLGTDLDTIISFTAEYRRAQA